MNGNGHTNGTRLRRLEYAVPFPAGKPPSPLVRWMKTLTSGERVAIMRFARHGRGVAALERAADPDGEGPAPRTLPEPTPEHFAALLRRAIEFDDDETHEAAACRACRAATAAAQAWRC